MFGFPETGLYEYRVYDSKGYVSAVLVDFDKKEVSKVFNDPLSSVFSRPFGLRTVITFEEFEMYMRSRVYSETYDGLEEIYDERGTSPRTLYQLLLDLEGRLVSDDIHIEVEMVC